MDKKGFALIEIIMAVTILALIVVPVCTLLSQNLYSNLKSREIMIATALAQEKIEELKAISFEQVCLKLGTEIEKNLRFNDMYFDRSVQVQLENENLIKITVEVQGKNGGLVHIATYRGNY